MVKSTIGAVLACLYVALSVWLVRSEGQSYRNSLKQARPTPAVTDNPVREHSAVANELPKADVAPPRAPEPHPAQASDTVATAPAPTPAPPAAETTGAKPGVPLRLSRNRSHHSPVRSPSSSRPAPRHPMSASLNSTHTGASRKSRQSGSCRT